MTKRPSAGAGAVTRATERSAATAEARSSGNRCVRVAIGILKVLALCMLGLLAGGWMMGTFVVVPAQRELDATMYAAVEQANTSYGQRYLPVLSGSSVVLLLTILIVDRKQRSLQRGLLITSLVLIAITVVYTALFMVPLNAEVDSWSIQAPPSDWQQTRDAWHTGQAFRTLLAMPALLLLAGAVVRAKPPALVVG